jgi:hypothetical protein
MPVVVSMVLRADGAAKCGLLILFLLVTLFPPTPTARMVLQGVLQELSYRIASFAMRNVCVVELRCSDSDKMVRGRQRMTTVSRGSRTTGSVARSVARSRPSRLYRDRRGDDEYWPSGGWLEAETRFDWRALQHQSRSEAMAAQAVHNSGARHDEPQRRYDEPWRRRHKRRYDEPSRHHDEPEEAVDGRVLSSADRSPRLGTPTSCFASPQITAQA